MTDADHPPALHGPLSRTIADIRGGDGPTLICTGGVHGNEPAGIHAAQEVARKLQALGLSGTDRPWRGRFVALVGNVGACEAADPTLRYIELDLNRVVTLEEISRARNLPPDKRHAEQQELVELLDTLLAIVAEAPHASTFLDLHTVSSPSPAFAYAEDSLPARRLGRALGLPLVLGFEEELSGLLADYVTSELGVLSLVVEAGTHSDPASVSVHEAAIWTVLEAQGMIDSASEAARFDVAQHLRAAAGRRAGRVFDIRQRVPVGSPPLEMLDTAQAFTRVWKGITRVATRHRPDRTETLRAPADGLLFMPNRQPRKRPDDDAFFVLRPVWRRLMWVSARLRAMPRAHRLLAALPGVRRVDEHSLHIDRSIAAVMARDVLHLFGYRVLQGTPAPYHRPWTRVAMACVAIPRAVFRGFSRKPATSDEVWIVRRHRLDL